jgi:hypothetical protein
MNQDFAVTVVLGECVVPPLAAAIISCECVKLEELCRLLEHTVILLIKKSFNLVGS